MCSRTSPYNKVHGVNMGPTWGRQDPGGSHVGPMNLAIWVCILMIRRIIRCIKESKISAASQDYMVASSLTLILCKRENQCAKLWFQKWMNALFVISSNFSAFLTVCCCHSAVIDGPPWEFDWPGTVATSVHYNDVIMGAIASQITSLTIVYLIVFSDADQRKHQSSASLAFVRGIHRGPVNSPHKWPVTRKMFPFDDVIMARLAWRQIFSNACVILFFVTRQYRYNEINFFQTLSTDSTYHAPYLSLVSSDSTYDLPFSVLCAIGCYLGLY